MTGCGTASPRPAAAAALFHQECGSCHSLTGHDSPRQQGGDLLGLRIGRAPLLQFVREMPVRPALTPAQTRELTTYLLSLRGPS
ncbi:MAG TPA: hypothetical protein VG223_11440 [Solirubrobacteraceae bacterium]|nr:hypothetical protein [Solirubrobacteraceae bacterium]